MYQRSTIPSFVVLCHGEFVKVGKASITDFNGQEYEQTPGDMVKDREAAMLQSMDCKESDTIPTW